ncbi:MAG: class I SAM-dependent methyltransferase [Bacteroidales bacterium]|nr:class I SAM-dependent methyltransferase [Bacteroidales bacterium]
MVQSARSLMFRIWYWYISKIDSNAEVTFMNYGYDDPSLKVTLDNEDEPNRYSIQLYHRLASAVDLKDKNIVEVGCGRGGGLAYIAKTFSPSNAIGIDLENRAVNFANNHHNGNGLKYKQGDAQNIPLESNSYDVLLNVESSHRYLDMNKFLSEVTRILKHDGYFLYTDFRYPHEMSALKESLDSMNLTLIEEQRINPNVILALKNDTERRKDLVKRLIPKIFQKTALNFAGVVDSPTYNQILSGDLVYYIYILQKNG